MKLSYLHICLCTFLFGILKIQPSKSGFIITLISNIIYGNVLQNGYINIIVWIKKNQEICKMNTKLNQKNMNKCNYYKRKILHHTLYFIHLMLSILIILVGKNSGVYSSWLQSQFNSWFTWEILNCYDRRGGKDLDIWEYYYRQAKNTQTSNLLILHTCVCIFVNIWCTSNFQIIFPTLMIYL